MAYNRELSQFASFVEVGVNNTIGITTSVGIGITNPPSKLSVIAPSSLTNELIQSWGYTSGTIDQYRLDLKQTVTSTVVRYNFSMINNNTSYDDVLVLDRGKVGIGTINPTTKLNIVTTDDTRGLRIQNGFSTSYAEIQFSGTGKEYRIGVGGSTATEPGTVNNFYIYDANPATVRFVIDSIGNTGIGATNPDEKLHVVGESNIANRTSYRSAPGDLFSFPGTENEIQFPGENYGIITVGCGTDVAGSLNNKYFTIYGPGGTSAAINVEAAEQNVVVWFNVAGAGSTPAVVGAGRSVGIAITTGSSAISVGNSITQQMSTDAGFTVATSGDGNVVFVPKTPENFSNPTVGTAGTVGFAVTTTQNGSGILSGSTKWVGGVLAPNGKIYGIPFTSTTVLVIDPETNTTSTFGSLSGTTKWVGGVLAPNGKIYGIPYASTTVLAIDPATNTTSTFGSLSGSTKWLGGVLAPNGKIYGIPFTSTTVLSIGGGTASIPDWYLSAYQNKF